MPAGYDLFTTVCRRYSYADVSFAGAFHLLKYWAWVEDDFMSVRDMNFQNRCGKCNFHMPLPSNVGQNYVYMKKMDVLHFPTQYYTTHYLGAYGTQNKIKRRTNLKLEFAIESCTPNFTLPLLTNRPLNCAQYNAPSHIAL